MDGSSQQMKAKIAAKGYKGINIIPVAVKEIGTAFAPGHCVMARDRYHVAFEDIDKVLPRWSEPSFQSENAEFIETVRKHVEESEKTSDIIILMVGLCGHWHVFVV